MSASLRAPPTLDAFLAWERSQTLRYEFDGAGPVAMTGGSVEHSVIATNLVRALEDRLRDTPAAPSGAIWKLIVAGRVRYPDAVVTCAPVPRGTDIVPAPVVVFEVISPTTAGTDRIAKNNEYRAAPSIRRYVMLEQDRIAATVFAREGDDWIGRVISGPIDLPLPELGIALPLDALYRDVAFPEAAAEG